MGALRTCCGFYCSFVALVGVYFFVVLSVMEYRGNATLTQIYAKDEFEKRVERQEMRGLAFLILAGIELILVGACFWCGNASMNESAMEEEAEMKRQ